MKPWTKMRKQILAILLLSGAVVVAGKVHADDLRVKIGQGSQIEFRCDGPIAAVLENRSGEVAELNPGTYILRVVDSPSFYRMEPLIAGIVSSPLISNSLTIPAAFSPNQESWVVELVRTPSKDNADRAEHSARTQLRGKIQVVESGGEYVVQMGPFPNRYLAQQGLQKAQRNGFPARIRDLGGMDHWENATAISPRAHRRLTPKGSGRSYQPKIDSLPDAPPPQRMTIEVPAEPQLDQEPTIELEPLPLFSEEDLALEPLALEPEEDILVQPFPDPQQEKLQPDVGLVPAPKAREKVDREPIRINPANPRRPMQPRQFARGPAPQQRRAAPAPRPQTRRRLAPPPPTPVPMPSPKQEAKPEAPVAQAAPVEPQQKPTLNQRPQNRRPQQPPMVVEQPRPPRPRSQPPGVAQTPPPPRPQTGEMDRWVPEDQPTIGSRVLRSIPFIRKWSWQKPLVDPSKGLPLSPEEQFAKSLQEPPSSGGESISGLQSRPGLDTVPYAPDMVDDAKKTYVAPSSPKDGDLDSLLEDDLVYDGSVPTLPGEEKLVPFESPETAKLPDDAESVTSIDDLTFNGGSSALVPPAPGETGSQAAPLFTPGASDQPPTTTKSSNRTAISGQPRLFNLPALGPVRRAHVQLFNTNGDPVTEPAAHIDLAPLSSSRLEHRGLGFSGSFQTYAPTTDQLVLVNVTDLSDYVAGILPEEISPEAPVEVLKAQAVLIRGYALVEAGQGLFAAYGFDLDGDSNATWPYPGTDSVTPAIRQAVAETESQVLIGPSGSPATPVYCFSSGGYLADAQSIWGGTGEPVPSYLTAKPDFDPADVTEFQTAQSGFGDNEDQLEDWLQSTPNTFDRDAAGSYFRWEVRFTDDEMTQLVNSYWNGTVGEVRSIDITRRARSGHAVEMEIRGGDQTVTARSSDMIREALGLNSSLIVVKERFGPGGGWIVYGGGLGHGVGFSQCGAIGLVSKKGANYKELLNYYFDGLLLGRRAVTRARSGA